MPLEKDRNREYQREYARARRAREKAMKELAQDEPPVPGEVAGLAPAIVTTDNVVALVDSLKRRRGRAALKQTDGERLGDGLADTAVLIQRMPQAALDAIAEGMRTGSPEPWKKYLASRRKP